MLFYFVCFFALKILSQFFVIVLLVFNLLLLATATAQNSKLVFDESESTMSKRGKHVAVDAYKGCLGYVIGYERNSHTRKTFFFQ